MRGSEVVLHLMRLLGGVFGDAVAVRVAKFGRFLIPENMRLCRMVLKLLRGLVDAHTGFVAGRTRGRRMTCADGR